MRRPPHTLRSEWGLKQLQRIEWRLARATRKLSPAARLRLSGRPPIRIDGQELEPDMQLMAALDDRRDVLDFAALTAEEVREWAGRGRVIGGDKGLPVAELRDLWVDGADGPLRARLYVPPGELDGPPALIVFFHGGGWVLGDLDSHDVACRVFARHAGALVLAVDYRLAPEHRFPAAVDDASAALRWAFANADELGADPGRVAVAGDSAGANLAAVAALDAARAGGPAPVLQVLLYPPTDFVEQSPSMQLFGAGFMLTPAEMRWYADQYAGDADRSDERMSILRAADLSGVAPAVVVTAGFDPLRDEGEAFAARLRDAGVPVVARRFPGLLHGFFNLADSSATARDAAIEVAGTTRGLLAAVGARQSLTA